MAGSITQSVGGTGRTALQNQFEQDLKFFQVFFLLVNRSCPIKKIDLVWAKTGPFQRSGFQPLMGTAAALKDPRFRLLHDVDEQTPDPSFCNLVNDYGRRFAETCAVSDKEAEEQVRRTGRPQVYRCHAGLIDIAVPVVCNGQHVATLLTGQVLREEPDDAQFAKVQRALRGFSHIDRETLKSAYRKVPVVSEDDINNTIEVLEVFADYLANTWKRLADAIEEEKRKVHEEDLDRKELGHLLIEGAAADRAIVRELMSRLRLTQCPNRVMVVALEAESGAATRRGSYDLALTTAVQAVESVCSRVENAMSTHLRRRGLCVFFRDDEEKEDSPARARAQSLALRILNAVRVRCKLQVRIGIGDRKRGWQELAESYQEARLALAADKKPVIVEFKEPARWTRDLSTAVDDICGCLSDRRFTEAEEKMASLPLTLADRFGRDPRSPGHRFFYASALDSMLLTAERLGCAAEFLSGLRGRLLSELEHHDSHFAPHEIFLEVGEAIVAEVRTLFVGRHQRIVRNARQIIDRCLDHPSAARTISLPGIAREIGVSAGHLSRTFRRITGQTLERYLMEQRVELSTRLLLEPLNNVSSVAERCGFSDPTYFARVFRKLVGCPPSQYARNPHLAAAAQARAAVSGRTAA